MKLNPNSIVRNHSFMVICYAVKNTDIKGKSHNSHIQNEYTILHFFLILYKSSSASTSLPTIGTVIKKKL